MEELSLIRKIILFRYYLSLIKKNKKTITSKENGLNLRVDRTGRIYTVLNCPEDVKKYGLNLAQKYIGEYIKDVDKLIVNLNMSEYVGVREIKQLNELDYLIILGYQGFDNRDFFSYLLVISGILISGGLLAIFSYIL